MGTIRIGTSGWVYPPWRGVFYPPGLPHRQELTYLAERVDTVEINGSFYSLQRPSSYLRWAEQTPADFRFAVKGSRFITHMKRLRDPGTALANFFASGVLALGGRLGPIQWHLTATRSAAPVRLSDFCPGHANTTAAATELAAGHDDRVQHPQLTADAAPPRRHALEVRHPGFTDPGCPSLLREHHIALVVA